MEVFVCVFDEYGRFLLKLHQHLAVVEAKLLWKEIEYL
jgi:hypothetical protein